MNNVSSEAKIAGLVLKKLVETHYDTQQEFADDYGIELRSLSRYFKDGITKIPTVSDLAIFFDVDFAYFFDKKNM